ncbi:hypothetical protein M9H77_32991 [Catharanthus roseus]|uniref:Uncharacterized protein n=1 Tax=Catharanthus roseus TaxID=4058 RepID=A0ACC0A5C1_CATRO|nr:hypothetical protein M9H77_32991 [Catharanthus roseus]
MLVKSLLFLYIHCLSTSAYRRKLVKHKDLDFSDDLATYIQSFLAGVPFIVIGFRDDSGRLVRTERLRTKDITQRVKMKSYWQYTANSTRLELLRADSCPDAITDHVDQLEEDMV